MRSHPKAAGFYATYTAGGAQLLPTYAASGCSPSASRVSSACSCLNTGTAAPTTTKPPTSPQTPSLATSTKSASTTTLTTSTKITAPSACKKDNCLRAAQHSSVAPFCSSYLAGIPLATPTGVAVGCSALASRISSACACLPTA